MGQTRYMISDAARMVSLEQHVLRYWEDELQLDIPRNEMGHRYYTEENIKELLRIKDLREKGYQLKAIRMYLKKEKRNELKEQQARKQVDLDGFVTLTNGKELGLSEEASEVLPSLEDEPMSRMPEQASRIKMEQFQALMTEIVAQAMRDNNEALTTHVEERILKEMKLDEAIRGGIRKKREKRAESSRLFAKKKKAQPEVAPVSCR